MPVRKLLHTLARDLRYAARGFRRAPLFAGMAIFAIALGIGAGTAVFSVVDRILFRSLPYQDSERLVSFGMTAPIAPQEFMLGYDYLDWRASQTPFAALGSWSGMGECDLGDTNAVRLRCAHVDAAFLQALGVQLAVGRNFTPEEDRPNSPRAALVSYGLWQSRFGGDRAIAGKTAWLDGHSVAIAGVLPSDFEMPTLVPADVLLPQALDEAAQRTHKIATMIYTVARLKPGVTPEQATMALRPLFENSMQWVSPAFRKDVSLRVRSLRDRQMQDARTASWILLAAVGAVLLIACANVANLLLARSASRQRELTIRAALGASRTQIAGQALMESLLLGIFGGGAGCGLAFWLLRLFLAVAPEGIPHLKQARLDGRVLLVTMAISLGCGLLFGLVPALRNARAANVEGRSVGGRRGWWRQGLVAAQMAGTLVLLAGAGLLLRSLWNLENQPLGIHTGGVLTAEITLGRTLYPDAPRRLAFFEELESRLRRIPGVGDVAFADTLPPTGTTHGSMLYNAIDVAGRPQATDGTGGPVVYRQVTPAYFRTLGIPMVRGRGFEEVDRDPGHDSVVLSEALARRMFPGEGAIGKQIRPGRVGPWLTVIGVAHDVKNGGLAQNDDPEYYTVRKHQAVVVGAGAIAVLRTHIVPGALGSAVRAEVSALDPTLPVKLETMEQRVGVLAERPRFNAMLLGIFAGMGLLLAAIGLYGVASFLVAQRVQEIGVRMALGATPRSIALLVLKQSAWWTALGTGAGLAGSLLTLRWLQTMLFQVPARDPWMLSASAALLFAVTLVAAWWPSRRAANVDPIVALRNE
ncbi:MAG TPA: ABC transporter permease [Bryobacteraceae bacterium]|nr:ABC transporter permease [Bryobacteraceae bacterium]